MLTGETHTYNAGNAAYNGIAPANPFSLENGGWGAWKKAGRVSTVNLNDQLATANGVGSGGRQTVYTAGLNWYVSRNVRFMFNYLHGDIAKQISATNVGNCRRQVRRVRDANSNCLLSRGLGDRIAS